MHGLSESMQATAENLRAEIKKMEDIEAQSADVEPASPGKSASGEAKSELQNVLLLIEVLEMQDRFSGLERKVQLKVAKWKGSGVGRKVAQVTVVAKWGGELTIAGLDQAEELGRRLRSGLYPNDPTGLLRLHSSFRHDFKIYSSQEGRCQITAASFTKGFLDLEGDITPILVSLVTCDNFARGLLDEPIPKKQRDAVKENIDALLMSMNDLFSMEESCPITSREDLREAARRIGRPMELLHKLKHLCVKYLDTMMESISCLTDELRTHEAEHDECELFSKHIKTLRKGMVPRGPGPQVPLGLTDELKRRWLHLRRKAHRWRKLFHGFAQPQDPNQGFADANVTYDVTKIPDVWDNIYYDLMTHRSELGEKSCAIAEEIVDLLQPLNAWVCWSEYGISQQEKLRIGIDVTWRLIGKILVDLEFLIDETVGSLTDEAGKIKSAGMPTAQESGGTAASGTDLNVDETMAQKASWPDGDEGFDASPRTASLGDSGSPGPSPGPATPSKKSKSDARRSTLSGELGKKNKPTAVLKRALQDSNDWHPRLNEEVARITGIKHTERVKSRVYVTSASTLHSLFNVLWHGNVDGIVSNKGQIIDLNYLTHIVFRCYECGQPAPPPASSAPAVRKASLSSPLMKASRSHPDIAALDTSSPRSAVGKLPDGYPAELMGKLKVSSSHPDVASLGRGNLSSSMPTTPSKAVHQEEPRAPHLNHTDEAQRAKARYRVEISVSPGVQVLEDGVPKQWPLGSELHRQCCGVAPLEVVAESVPLAELENFLTEVVRDHTSDDSSDGEAGSDKE
jgi:hypothetical protein